MEELNILGVDFLLLVLYKKVVQKCLEPADFLKKKKVFVFFFSNS